MNELPPKNRLERTLWMMGHSKEQRKIIIDTARKMTVASGVFFDPVDLGIFCMPPTVLPKQKWYVRLKFWLFRQWGKIGLRP